MAAPLVVNLIGVITIYCGAQSNVDPCTTAKTLRVFVPDGRFNEKVCKKIDGNPIRPHEGYVRIRGVRPTSFHWSGMDCDDKDLNGICVMYPLAKDVLTISHVTEGTQISSFDGANVKGLRWSCLSPDEKITHKHPADTIAEMVVKNGDVKFIQYEVDGKKGPVFGEITVPNVSGDTVITASHAGANRTITVGEGAVIDIVNLPFEHAVKDAGLPMDSGESDDDHFYLHYMMADTRPDEVKEQCCGPLFNDSHCDVALLHRVLSSDCKVAPTSTHHEATHSASHDGKLTVSISCSNTVYP